MRMDEETRAWLESHFSELNSKLDNHLESFNKSQIEYAKIHAQHSEKIDSHEKAIQSIYNRTWGMFVATISAIGAMFWHFLTGVINSGKH